LPRPCIFKKSRRMAVQDTLSPIANHFVKGVAQQAREFYLTENNNAGGLCVISWF
jgi:hypothetical protein